MKRSLTIGATMLVLLLLLLACTSRNEASPTPGGSAASPTGSAQASPSSGADSVRLEPVAPEGTFEMPLGLEKRTNHEGKLYVVEQPGRIRLLDLARPDAEPVTVLDITDRVNDKGNEEGLLGLAFHPDKPDEAYVNYTTETHTRISRFKAAAGKPDTFDPASEQVILTFEQPYSNHNGGQLAFGPDGMLYIGTGDGGGAGDPQGHGQNKNSLLGKMLRIDVNQASGGTAYAIPADNPFAQGGGAPEIYSYGMRNPWRFSFDSETGKLWAADVGQNKLEEINLIEKGGNYGWNIREGTACFQPADGCQSEGMIPPVYEYDHDLGFSVTGGYVYRGKLLPELAGWYLYADYATGTIWALQLGEDGKAENRTLLETELQITSFGVDHELEVYVVAQDGGIFRFHK